MSESILVLKKYFVSELNLKINKKFKNINESIDLKPKLQRVIKKIDNSSVVVALKVEISDEGNKPFFGSIVIEGLFECENWENSDEKEAAIKETTVMILYPYLRQALSTATTMLNVPTYVLPVINVHEVFNKNIKTN